MRQLIGAGAEARIYLDGSVTKERFQKAYRIEPIDVRLRQSRTRREAKVLDTLQKLGFPSPKLVSQDKAQTVVMEYIDGPKIRDILEKSDYRALSKGIGENVGIMHSAHIIHGDLTTSNMILKGGKIFFIDFGLSFFSQKVEDKAVDLHLLRQALNSKHYTICDACFDAALQGYRKTCLQAEEVLKRMEQVEMRGRYKHKH